MKTSAIVAFASLLSLIAAAPARTPVQPRTPSATAIINLISDLASEETRQFSVVVGTQADTDFILEAAQISTVEDANGNADPNADNVVCVATENFSSNVAGTFTVDTLAEFNGGKPTEITSISCEFQ